MELRSVAQRGGEMNREPYSIWHVLLAITAPLWFPALLVLYIAGYALALIFMVLCAVVGAVVVATGSVVGWLIEDELGVGLRQIGTDIIKFGVETIREMY